MKKLTVILIWCAVAFFATSCLHEDEDHHLAIRFVNQWDNPIYIEYNISWNDDPYEDWGILFFEAPLCEVAAKILPGETDDKTMRLIRTYYESLDIKDTIIISVFNGENPDKIDSECFLVRYYLSKEDLKKVNYHVSYPPIEAMKDFYMKPSYEEVMQKAGL